MMKRLVRLLGSSGLGPSVRMRTVCSSTLTTSTTLVSRPFMSEFSCLARMIENTTSSAVKGLPLWYFTPSRSLNSHTLGSSVMRHDVASRGASFIAWSRNTSES